MATTSNNIEDWILNFLSKPNTTFAGLPPCPYAKRALFDDKVEVHQVSASKLKPKLTHTLKNFPEDKDVVLLCTDPKTISAQGLESLAISTDDYIILDDHPAQPEEVNGILLNQGTYAILFVQRRTELEHAREELAQTDYYKHFSKEYKDSIIQR
jgi:hypothetical protein|tara:strand:- start:399 stop:863 length:465 start_codon:yes stop_codon:yes gene_type:complete